MMNRVKRYKLQFLPTELVRHNFDLQAAMLSLGYSYWYARTPHRLQKTKHYKQVMEPVLKRLENQRDKILTSLDSKDLNQENFRDLVYALDKVNKDIQLLGGQPTDITEFHITEGDEDKSVESTQESEDPSEGSESV